MDTSHNGFHQRIPSGLFRTDTDSSRSNNQRMHQNHPQTHATARPTAPDRPASSNSCPACGGRVLRTNAFCLHCGHDLPRDEEAREENRTFQLFTPIMVTLVLIGAAYATWLGVDLYLLNPVEEPVTFQSNSTQTTCFGANDSHRAQAHLADGWTETHSRDDGLRCFSK